MEKKFSSKKFIITKISKANAHDLKKSEYFMANPIIKKGRGLKIEYNCGEILNKRSWMTNMKSAE